MGETAAVSSTAQAANTSNAASNLMAGSHAIQAFSSMGNAYSQSRAIKSKGRYEKTVGDINARMAELQAEDAIKRGDKESSAHKSKVKQLIGSQRVASAGQGVDVSSGSAAEIQEDTAIQGAQDAMTIKNNAWREAWGYRVQGMNSKMQGNFAMEAAKNESRNTLLTGGLQALSYGAQAGYYYKGKAKQKNDYNYPGG